jgi:hypothetical protein
MDSHGSATLTPSPITDAPSRSADGDVTRRRQTEPEIPGFRNVEQLPDGSWRAVHVGSSETITADTFEHLERVEAPIVRIAHGWRTQGLIT